MSNNISCYASVRLVRNEEEYTNAFGPGVASLLRKVEEMGSLNKAAKSMHMAYSKAWRIIRNTESQFGFTLIDRDGPRGSSLTEQGRKLLAMYDEIHAAVMVTSKEIIKKWDF